MQRVIWRPMQEFPDVGGRLVLPNGWSLWLVHGARVARWQFGREGWWLAVVGNA